MSAKLSTPYNIDKINIYTTPFEAQERDDINGFDAFWRYYPRKVGKEAARRAWHKLKPDAELTAELIDALTVQKKQPQWLRDGGAYIPYPATWLNGRRWEDEIPDGREGGGGGTTASEMEVLKEW